MNKQMDDLLEVSEEDRRARQLETIVIDLAREFEETIQKDVSKDLYEIIQSHIHDAYELGEKHNDDTR